jgi:hypothetical protein
VIVWDSREAEERNARGLLAERTAKLAKARRHTRLATVSVAVSAALVFAATFVEVRNPGILPIVGIFGASVGFYNALRGRHWARDSVTYAAEMLAAARDNHDRVFGRQL